MKTYVTLMTAVSLASATASASPSIFNPQSFNLGGNGDRLLATSWSSPKKAFVYSGFDADLFNGRIYEHGSSPQDHPVFNQGTVVVKNGFAIGTSGAQGIVIGAEQHSIADISYSDPTTPVDINSMGAIVGFSFRGNAIRTQYGASSVEVLADSGEGGAGVAITQNGWAWGHVFTTAGYQGVYWDNAGVKHLLADDSVVSRVSSASDSFNGKLTAGGDYNGLATFFTVENGVVSMSYPKVNGVPIRGTVSALSSAGYYGIGGEDGRAYFGQVGMGDAIDAASYFGISATLAMVSSIAVSSDAISIAYYSQEGAWATEGVMRMTSIPETSPGWLILPVLLGMFVLSKREDI